MMLRSKLASCRQLVWNLLWIILPCLCPCQTVLGNLSFLLFQSVFKQKKASRTNFLVMLLKKKRILRDQEKTGFSKDSEILPLSLHISPFPMVYFLSCLLPPGTLSLFSDWGMKLVISPFICFPLSISNRIFFSCSHFSFGSNTLPLVTPESMPEPLLNYLFYPASLLEAG